MAVAAYTTGDKRFRSRLYRTRLMHARFFPRQHRFEYPALSCALNLDDLDELNQLRLFSRGRLNLLSFVDTDYLRREEGSLAGRMREYLRGCGKERYGAHLMLVTTLRLLGYVFNPVSFYFCYDAEGTLGVVVAEVNNTFGERHLYTLPAPVSAESDQFSASTSKQFHVSPFYDLSGSYHFRFADIEERLDISIDLHREHNGEDRCELVTRIWEKEQIEFTDRGILKTVLRQPFDTALTFPRILLQAASLSFREHLPFYSKPIANNPSTIRIALPTALERFSMGRVFRFLERLKGGALRIILPEGEVRTFGDPASSVRGEIHIHSYRAFTRILRSGDIGFGEGYVEKEWDSPDLGSVLRVFALNLDVMDDRKMLLTWSGRIWNILKHKLRSNSPRNSRSNIREHYDLSNELFRSFLDPSMTYSCGIFADESSSLEEAQARKISEIIRKAELKPTDRVLEIGCGWGALAMTAAREIGCHVTAVTLSTEQRELALQRIQEAGLSEKISVALMDYRDIEGEFDKIISIEMIEAIGHEYLGTFFEVCDRLLKPSGKVVLQVITMPDQRYTWYRYGCDWIQKYIFPGGVCPSLSALSAAMAKDSSLVVEQIENIGLHYARTLREWRNRFADAKQELEKQGFDRRFQRIWDYYLTYCEEGFTTEALSTHQLVLQRAPAKRAP